jgi:hypothetical protein
MGKIKLCMKCLLEYIKRGDYSFVADMDVELYSINIL